MWYKLKYIGSCLLFFIICTGFISCMASKKSNEFKPVKVWFFTQQNFYGNIMVDENGNPSQKGYWFRHFIVVEIQDSIPPIFNAVFINYKQFSISNQKVVSNLINFARDAKTQQKISVQPQKSHQLLVIEIEDFESDNFITVANTKILGIVNPKKLSFNFEKEPIAIQKELIP